MHVKLILTFIWYAHLFYLWCFKTAPVLKTDNYSVSQKIPHPWESEFFSFFHKLLRIFNRFLHTYYAFLCAVVYQFLFNYIQLWRSYKKTKHKFIAYGSPEAGST